MGFNPDELRQQFDRLSDEALLEVTREDLVDLARDIYDAELSARGLTRPVEEAPPPTSEQPEEADGLVLLAEFDTHSEATMAHAILTSAGIPASVKQPGSFRSTASPRILVPAQSLEEARAVLDTPISDEELAAQAEAAGQEPD